MVATGTGRWSGGAAEKGAVEWSGGGAAEKGAVEGRWSAAEKGGIYSHIPWFVVVQNGDVSGSSRLL